MVPTGPDDEVSLVDKVRLLGCIPSDNELHPLLLSPLNPLVQLLRIAPQPREGIEVAILLGEVLVFELMVAVLLGVFDLVVEDLDLVSV